MTIFTKTIWTIATIHMCNVILTTVQSVYTPATWHDADFIGVMHVQLSERLSSAMFGDQIYQSTDGSFWLTRLQPERAIYLTDLNSWFDSKE